MTLEPHVLVLSQNFPPCPVINTAVFIIPRSIPAFDCLFFFFAYLLSKGENKIFLVSVDSIT